MREEFAGSPVWLFSRPWGIYKRDVLFQLLFSAIEDFSRGTVPPTVGRVLMVGHHDSIAETRRGCEIATGMAFRRLVAWCLARQFAKTVESVCSQFQFALSTRAEQIAWATSSEPSPMATPL